MAGGGRVASLYPREVTWAAVAGRRWCWRSARSSVLRDARRGACACDAPRRAPCSAPCHACFHYGTRHARLEHMVRRRNGDVGHAAVVRAVGALLEHSGVRVDLALLLLPQNLPGDPNDSSTAGGLSTAGAAGGSERSERSLATKCAELHHRLRQPMRRRGGRRRQPQSGARGEEAEEHSIGRDQR